MITRVVPMAEVPRPPAEGNGKWQRLVRQLRTLPKGHAMEITMRNAKTMQYARQSMRATAKAEGLVLSTTRDREGLRLYVWLEPTTQHQPEPQRGTNQ